MTQEVPAHLPLLGYATSHKVIDDDAPISNPESRLLAAATSASLSVLTGAGLSNAFAGVTYTAYVQAVGTDGVAKTTGGDTFYLCVDNGLGTLVN